MIFRVCIFSILTYLIILTSITVMNFNRQLAVNASVESVIRVHRFILEKQGKQLKDLKDELSKRI